MRVGYSRGYLAFNVCLGLLFLGLALGTPHTSAFPYYAQLFAGIVILLGAPLSLKRPVFEVGEHEVTLFAMIGPLKRHFPFSDKREVRIEGDKIFVGARKLPVKRWLCNRADWERLAAALTFE